MKSDAPIIAEAVMGAVGEDICIGLAGSKERLPLVTETFERLAADDHAQYSYRNALIARTEDGTAAGVIVAYDGARLHELRPRFIEVANEVLGMSMSDKDFVDETDSSEYYLDSLYVRPGYRGKGVATALIEAAVNLARNSGKPSGLLVDPDNPKARELYERLGFVEAGRRPFARISMYHMKR